MNTNSSPTTHNWLTRAASELKSAGIATAELDSLVLLEDCIGTSRAHLLAHPETELTNTQLTKLNQQMERRKNHEPLAYIRGKTEFYGREFIVNRYTLEPRPETETMIELLKKQLVYKNEILADIGTGSGAIAITAQLELPNTSVIASDVSYECLGVARKNNAEYGTHIEFFKGDLLGAFEDRDINILLCNLPYVPDDFSVNTAARHEPALALFGGKDGLDLYRTLFAQIAKRSQKPRLIYAESLPFQHTELATIAKKFGYSFTHSEDFIQIFEPQV